MRFLRLLLICLVVLVAAYPTLDAKPNKRPKATALAGIVSDGPAATLGVIGGCVAGKGWVGSDAAAGLMPKGDSMSLYVLGTGRIGEVKVTSSGVLHSETATKDEGSVWGLEYDARVVLDQTRHPSLHEFIITLDDGGEVQALGIWHLRNSPAPHWVTGEMLDVHSAEYRRVIGEWLTSKGVGPDIVKTIIVSQIVRADVNGDKRDEVFLAFRTPNAPFDVTGDASSKTTFSYLVMRYLPPGSHAARTVVINSDPWYASVLLGFCDLDGDGWAEVATSQFGSDYFSTQLAHWLGDRFERIQGVGAGE